LRQVQGDQEAAEELLQQCLEIDGNFPMALLRMGHLHLCQEQVDKAIQFLQKCLLQPCGTMSFGASQQGAAHLYLSVAHYWRDAEVSRGASRHSTGNRSMAQEHFDSALELLPVLARSLESIGAGRGSSTGRSQSLPSGRGPFSGRSAEAVNLLVSGRPPRVGMVDLTPKQAEVVVLMASTVGLASPTSLHSLQVSPQAFAGRLAGAIDEHAEACPGTWPLAWQPGTNPGGNHIHSCTN